MIGLQTFSSAGFKTFDSEQTPLRYVSGKITSKFRRVPSGSVWGFDGIEIPDSLSDDALILLYTPQNKWITLTINHKTSANAWYYAWCTTRRCIIVDSSSGDGRYNIRDSSPFSVIFVDKVGANPATSVFGMEIYSSKGVLTLSDSSPLMLVRKVVPFDVKYQKTEPIHSFYLESSELIVLPRMTVSSDGYELRLRGRGAYVDLLLSYSGDPNWAGSQALNWSESGMLVSVFNS